MRLRLALVAWLVMCPKWGHAEEERQVRLRYVAPAECPPAEAFVAEVRARTALARISEEADADTTLDVQIRNVEGGSAGTMRLYTGSGATTPREVKAATCVQVASALAVMVALAIDPEASTEPVPKPTMEEPAPPPAPPPVAPRRTVSNAPPPARFRWKAGASFEALGGVTRDLVPGVRPFFEMVHEDSSHWGFAARLSGNYAWGTVRIPEGSGDFTLWALRVEGCPLHYRPWTPLWLSSCLALDGGEIDAAGRDVTPAAEVQRAWITGGALGRVELRLFDLLSLELSGGVLFPFVRDRFYLGAGATLHRTPAVAGTGAIGLGVLFP